jgi:hypothetical protein
MPDMLTTMTDQDRRWMGRQDELTPDEKEVVDATWKNLREEMQYYNLKPQFNDIAASLEGAMVRYLIESRRP